ncbi:hypothetical protein [Aquabacterium sp.]|uniref:hypothetical protein n=1 Tax=Aquabacterium sp. TaxID=1872578 RepID=UPI004037A496
MNIEQVIARATAQARKDQQAVHEFHQWVAKEQAKVADPKARSYSIVAQWFDLGTVAPSFVR